MLALVALALVAEPSTTVQERRPSACAGAVVFANDDPLPHVDVFMKTLPEPFLASAYDRHVYVDANAADAAGQRKLLVNALEEMRGARCVVDLFLLTRKGIDIARWLEERGARGLPRLRLVYDASDSHWDHQDERYLALGARAVVRHHGYSVGYYLTLVPAWIEGKPLKDVIERADDDFHAALVIGDAAQYWPQMQPSIAGDEHVFFRRREPAFAP